MRILEVYVDSLPTWELQVLNCGLRIGVVDSLWFEGDAWAFDCPLDLPLRIEPTDTAFVPVYFQPRADTTYSATLYLSYGEEQTLSVELWGRGKPNNAVEDDKRDAYPTRFGLDRVYPNPFNSTVRIAFNLPETSPVSIGVYDLTGRQISRSIQTLTAGSHSVTWSGAGQPSGLYFLKIEAAGQTASQRLLLVR